MVNGCLQLVQACLLPPSCILCGDRGQPPALDICSPCAADLPPNLDACPVCAHPLSDQETAWPCERCQHLPRVFDRAVSPYIYDYPLDHLIQGFKYGGALPYGRVLGTLLAHHIRAHSQGPLPDALIPVPLHSARHRERGFNQAYELARPLSRLLGIPIADDLCHRRRETADQTELTAAERQKNVRDAFRLLHTPAHRHVALIDDVLTTGSTTNEIARVLRRAGVGRIEVWTVARAR